MKPGFRSSSRKNIHVARDATGIPGPVVILRDRSGVQGRVNALTALHGLRGLSKLTGINAGTLKHLASGERRPTNEHLSALGCALQRRDLWSMSRRELAWRLINREKLPP